MLKITPTFPLRPQHSLPGAATYDLSDIGNALRLASVCAKFQRRLRNLRERLDLAGGQHQNQRPTKVLQRDLKQSAARLVIRLHPYAADLAKAGIPAQPIEPSIGQQRADALRRLGIETDLPLLSVDGQFQDDLRSGAAHPAIVCAQDSHGRFSPFGLNTHPNVAKAGDSSNGVPGGGQSTPHEDLGQLQAEWDRAGLIRRLRMIATTPVLAREFLILPALLLAGLAILPLIAAVLP